MITNEEQNSRIDYEAPTLIELQINSVVCGKNGGSNRDEDMELETEGD